MTKPLITDLATTPAVVNEVVSVLGYYTAGDGGGGNFYWDASSTQSPNGGTIISNGSATGRWKRLYDTVLSPLWFGARGNGTTDDTTSLVNTFRAAQGETIDGENKTYKVSNALTVGSDTTVRNFKFQHAGSGTDETSVFFVDGSTSIKRNILFENIYINGNRDNHTAIGAAEDGARHGIRCIGMCKHLTFRNVEAEYCASDGLELFSGGNLGLGGSDIYTFEYIKIEDCRFSWNRRHGISGDCIRGIELKNVELSYNGLDTPAATGKPDSHGSKGDRIITTGELYGNGVDWEGYENGTNIVDLVMDNVRAHNNATSGIQFWDQKKTADNGANWRAWDRIRIVNCYSDYGKFNTAAFATQTLYNSAIRIVGNPLTGTFRNIVIDNNFLKGNILLQSCDRVTITNNNAEFIYPVGRDERPNQLLYCNDVFIRDLHYISNTEPMLFYNYNSTGIKYENSKNNIESATKYLDVISSAVQDIKVQRIGNTLKFYMRLNNSSVTAGNVILKFKWWAVNNQPFKIINFYRLDNYSPAFNAVLKGSSPWDLTATSAYNFAGLDVFCEFETTVIADVF